VDGPSLKERSAVKHRLLATKVYKPLEKGEEGLFPLVEMPVEPVGFIVVAVRVVVSATSMAKLVAATNHRDALREKKRRREVFLLPFAQSLHVRIVCWPFCTAVPTPIVIATIRVVFAISFVMLVVVAHEVLKCEPIVRRDVVNPNVA